MSDEQALEVIRLRHRLRALALVVGHADSWAEAAGTLDRFRALSERLGDPDLLSEHVRWRVRFKNLGQA